MATQGGPAQPVSVVTSGPVEGGAAIPVAVVTDGRAVVGGPAQRVVVVTSGPVQGGPALPIVAAATGAVVAGGPAIPVYIVSGSFNPTPPAPPTPAINTTGLVSEYRFDEGSGLVLTDYRAGYNGTLGTGASDRPDWVSAGLDFVPANSDVVTNATMPDSVLTGACTVSIVCKIDTGSAFRAFIGKAVGGGGTQNPLDFRTDNSATPNLAVVRANAGLSIASGPAVTLGAYRMYSVVCSANIGTNPTFYIGAAATAGTGASGAGAPTGSSANLRIGRRADGVVQMDGIDAYLIIYDRALSGAEMAANYAAIQTYLALRGITLP